MKTQLATALKGTSLSDLLQLTEMLYNDVRTQIKDGTRTDQESIRACNAARKEIVECKKHGIGG